MTTVSHQTVRLSRGRHASQSAGVCAMELASMLAHEPFSDRPRSVSPTIGAFVRTYNDGLDDARRQDLYAISAAIIGTAARRRIERERVSLCLAFAVKHGGRFPSSRASLAVATPEVAGSWAAQTALANDLHDEARELLDRLTALGRRRTFTIVPEPLEAHR